MQTCVVILMIFGIRLTTTSNTTMRPTTPPGVGSCEPITQHIVEKISRTVLERRVAVLEYRAVCTVPGVTRGTVSQYTIYTQLRCYFRCDDETHFVVRLNLMCHDSTKSFRYPTIKAYRGATAVYIRPYYLFNPPPSRTDCGICGEGYGRSNCGGININRAIRIVVNLIISSPEGFTC